MELLALVDLLENAPYRSTLVYVDASYILHGASRRRLNARAWVRQPNRALWRRFDEACAKRERVGAETTLIKCSSHGKDSRQHASIDLWNGRADRMAERFGYRAHFRTSGGFTRGFRLRSPLPGPALRGDPRLHIRNCFEEAHLEATHALGVGGFAARLVCTNPGVSICDVVDSRSPYRMAKIGDLGNLPFAMALKIWPFALQTCPTLRIRANLLRTYLAGNGGRAAHFANPTTRTPGTMRHNVL